MKVNKIAVLIVIVLVSLRAGEKPATASSSSSSSSTNLYSLADIKLEKEIEANKSWDSYIKLRQELMYYEKHYPHLLKYDLKGSNSVIGRYSLKEINVVCTSNCTNNGTNSGTTISVIDKTIAEEILNLINKSVREEERALVLKKEEDSYEDRIKSFS